MENIRDKNVKCWHNLHSVLNLSYWNLESISLIILELCAFLKRSNFNNFQQFFIITFDWNGNFEFWWFYQKDLVQIYQNISYFKFKKYFVSIKINFLVKNELFEVFSCTFFSNYCQSLAIPWIMMILWEKSYQNLSEYIQFYLKTEFIEKLF